MHSSLRSPALHQAPLGPSSRQRGAVALAAPPVLLPASPCQAPVLLAQQQQLSLHAGLPPPHRSRGHHLSAVAQPSNHPDWPAHPERYADLRDEDVLELEQFLRHFQRARGQQQRLHEEEEEEGPGEVYLVGTGPGDPGPLTMRAVQLMQTADVVLYDRLVSDDILRLVGPQARMVYVGKHSGFHTRSQEEIHALLLAFAEAGATVIRLKGGDPYVFGRGGEEVQYLAQRGVQVHCVPGITAASGICAELGIPMTHRGVATSVRFLTGHAKDGGEQELLDSTVQGAADPHTTLVVYMGLQTLPRLRQQLAAHGMRDDQVPAVAVERGTTRRQRVVWGTFSELPERAVAAGLKSPTLIIIGQVVALAPGWQQWEAQGRPVAWKVPEPRHAYRVPSVDVQQLQASAVGGTSAVLSHRAATIQGHSMQLVDVTPLPVGAPTAPGTATQPAPPPAAPPAAPTPDADADLYSCGGGVDDACPLPGFR